MPATPPSLSASDRAALAAAKDAKQASAQRQRRNVLATSLRVNKANVADVQKDYARVLTTNAIKSIEREFRVPRSSNETRAQVAMIVTRALLETTRKASELAALVGSNRLAPEDVVYAYELVTGRPVSDFVATKGRRRARAIENTDAPAAEE